MVLWLEQPRFRQRSFYFFFASLARYAEQDWNCREELLRNICTVPIVLQDDLLGRSLVMKVISSVLLVFTQFEGYFQRSLYLVRNTQQRPVRKPKQPLHPRNSSACPSLYAAQALTMNSLALGLDSGPRRPKNPGMQTKGDSEGQPDRFYVEGPGIPDPGAR